MEGLAGLTEWLGTLNSGFNGFVVTGEQVFDR